jgi:hypothetical protein
MVQWLPASLVLVVQQQEAMWMMVACAQEALTGYVVTNTIFEEFTYICSY